MKEEHILYPNDAIVIVNCLETLPGGRSLNLDAYDKAVIDSGAVVYKEGGKYIPLSGAKIFEEVKEADKGTTKEIKVYKGSCSLKVGTEIKTGIKVESVDTSHEAYDTLKLDKPIGEALSKDGGLYKAPRATAEWVGIVIGTVVKERPHVGIMVRGTVNEAVMPFAVKEEEKKKLPLIRFYAE